MKRFLFLPLLSVMPLLAQAVEWDSSGNGLLSGDYRFREIVWSQEQGTNGLTVATGTYGIIRFNGFGAYTIDAKRFSSATNQITNVAFSNTYVISASGLGFIRRPSQPGDIQGMISNDVFIGSSTDKETNNLFIATRVGSTMTTATFNQSYTLAYTDVRVPDLSQTRNVMFAVQGDGIGGLGALNLEGQLAVEFNITNQSIANATYSFSGGIGTLNFNVPPSSNTLISGNKEMYVSPDGAFVFGGSTTGWDMFVGLRTPTTPVAPSVFDYLYYQAGIDVDRGTELTSFLLDTYYGAFTPRGSDLIGHQRILLGGDVVPFNFTYSDEVILDPNGFQVDFTSYRHLLSSDGRYRVGVGRGRFLGINVAVKAPVLTGPGVFLNPVGVVNAAGFTPFTTGISPGEVITLFGTGIAEGVVLDESFPLTLNGLQVRINGKLAPIYKTSPGEVSVVVPYDVQVGDQSLAELQVFRNGNASNKVTAFLYKDTGALFTLQANGLGYLIARHGDFSLITPEHPAQPGETIMLAASGLGPTIPPIVAGTPAPVNPFSVTPEKFIVRVTGKVANVTYSGLAPLLGGLYQLNITIPPDLTPGADAFVEIEGPSSTSNQAKLPIGLP